MKIFALVFAIALLLPLSPRARAMEFSAPTVPESGAEAMPETTDNLGQALAELGRKALALVQPDLREAAKAGAAVLAAVLAASLLNAFRGMSKGAAALVLTLAVSGTLLGTANTMVRLGGDTVEELADYGKLLFPVLTAAMAAQGGGTTSAALYTGTIALDLLLGELLSAVLVPTVYLLLALAVANSAVGGGPLKKLRDLVKGFLAWTLKTVLVAFTTYMSITGVVSGATDAAALKATKLGISTAVPVVGGVLADASEAVLVSAGVMKNAAGVYGIVATLAILLAPFLRIAANYFVLKLTAAVCGVFADGPATELVSDFSTAMGLLLAMTAAAALLLLISTVCFLKEVG